MSTLPRRDVWQSDSGSIPQYVGWVLLRSLHREGYSHSCFVIALAYQNAKVLALQQWSNIYTRLHCSVWTRPLPNWINEAARSAFDAVDRKGTEKSVMRVMGRMSNAQSGRWKSRRFSTNGYTSTVVEVRVDDEAAGVDWLGLHERPRYTDILTNATALHHLHPHHCRTDGRSRNLNWVSRFIIKNITLKHWSHFHEAMFLSLL